MSEIKHTALPWKVVSDPHFDNGLVYTSVQPDNVDEEAMKPLAMANGEFHVCRMSHTAAPWRFNYHRANADFIVTACNSYYGNQAEIAKLREENARLREALGTLTISAHEFHENAMPYLSDTTLDGDWNLAEAEAQLSVTALPNARAALTKEPTP